MTLLIKAVLATPVEALEIAFTWEKEVINRVISPFITKPRSLRSRRLDELCECNKGGDCLCYLSVIKNEWIDTAWHTDNGFRTLKDWTSLGLRGF